MAEPLSGREFQLFYQTLQKFTAIQFTNAHLLIQNLEVLGTEPSGDHRENPSFAVRNYCAIVRPDVTSHILRISSNHELYCLPAGLLTPDYARQLHFIDMSAWYREEINPLQDLLDILGHELDFKPDVILLDARTGITPLSGPLLFDLADLVIIGFSPNSQTKIGTEALFKALLASKTRRKLTPEPRFLLSPIPASTAPEVVKQYQDRAQRWIDDWLSLLSDKLRSGNGLMASDITHFVPYREAIATSEQIECDRSRRGIMSR